MASVNLQMSRPTVVTVADALITAILHFGTVNEFVVPVQHTLARKAFLAECADGRRLSRLDQRSLRLLLLVRFPGARVSASRASGARLSRVGCGNVCIKS